MMKNITNNQTQTIIINRDGQYDSKVSLEPQIKPLDELKDYIRLQVRMFTYDRLHGTNYRQVRNQLVRQKRNQAFESRIGLCR
jgi:hypothetical protein